MSITEKMNTIPIGLQLPKELQSLHESGELISEDQIWKKNSSFVERIPSIHSGQRVDDFRIT